MSNKIAILYRMVMPEHICPYCLNAKHLLETQGYRVDDRLLRTCAETDAFKVEQGVKTTPRTFIGNERIGVMTICARISANRGPIQRRLVTRR